MEVSINGGTLKLNGFQYKNTLMTWMIGATPILRNRHKFFEVPHLGHVFNRTLITETLALPFQ